MPKRKAAPAKRKQAVKRPEANGNGSYDGGGLEITDLKKIFDDAAKVEEGRPALKWVDVECPHCNEEFEVRVDPGEGGGDMVEECHSCSKPVSLSVEVDEDGEVSVSAYQM